MKKILAHYAGARLYQHVTGQLPSPGQLARILDGHSVPPLAPHLVAAVVGGFGARGDVELAKRVLAEGRVELGQVYQRLRQRQQKKNLGQVFTPIAAARGALAMVSGTPRRIIDPACGAGEFLLAAAERWPEAELSGVDIDPLALAVARSRLALAGTKFSLKRDNALKNPPQGSWDLVAGNPPWGIRVGPGDVAGFAMVGKRMRNSFVYFIELAHNLLVPGGSLVLIVPEAFAKVWAYRRARGWLLERFAVIGLEYVPNLFAGYYAPALVLAARKKPALGAERVPVFFRSGAEAPRQVYNTVPGQALQQERFNINWNRDIEALWDQCCQDALFLREADLQGPLPPGQAVVDFSLGIVTGANKRFVASQPQDGDLPLLRAADVEPFRIRTPSNWLLYDVRRLQQAAPLAKYQVEEKLVYRFVSRELVVAVDRTGALTLNNLNLIIPLRLPFAADYLAALLNSRLINTLYMYRFFTGKVLTRHLKQLPLKVGSAREQQQITALARELAGGRGRREELEKMVYNLYQLDERQVRLAEEEYARLKQVFFV